MWLALQLELCLPRLLSSPKPGGLDRRTSGFRPESWPQGQSGTSYASLGFFFPILNHLPIFAMRLMRRVYAVSVRSFRYAAYRLPALR
jgi:hypothetical protein